MTDKRNPRGVPGASDEQLGGGLDAQSTSRLRVLPGHEPSAWMRAAVADALADRDGQVCQHAADAPALVTCLWWPGRFVCPDCLVLLNAPAETYWQCDRCGGDGYADGITLMLANYTMRTAVGDTPARTRNVSVVAGVCKACAAREGVAS